MDIKFVYFDVGGVLVLDFSKTDKWDMMLDDLAIYGDDRMAVNEIFDTEEPLFCTGEKIAESFHEILMKYSEKGLPENYNFVDDLVSRFETNIELQAKINEIFMKCKVGLLTNMYVGMLENIMENGLLPEVEWDVVIDSSIVNMRKPQKEIFILAQELAQTPPENILFVENSKMHTDAAEKLGWQTFLYDPADIIGSNEGLTRKIYSK